MSLDTKYPNLKKLHILSIHRSGSTLFQSLLDGHPELIVDIADSKFFDKLPELVSLNPSERVGYFKKIIINYIFNENSKYYQDFLSHIDIDQLHENFDQLVSNNYNYPQLYKAYFEALGNSSKIINENSKYIVDKILKNELYCDLMIKWWPNSKIIYICRDPRDVYASYKIRDIKNSRTVTKVDALVYTWGNSVKNAIRLANGYMKNNILVLRYEDLVENKESIIKSVANFLNIKLNDILFIPTKGNGKIKWLGNAASGRKKTTIDSLEKEKYKRVLTLNEIGAIEQNLKKEMNYLNYSLDKEDTKFIPNLSLKTKNFLRKHRDKHYHNNILKKIK